MLVELMVENYAVVERVRLRFHTGLNLLTGETGSGKSIVVDALSLLFGGRASAEMIRTGADRARVAGIFEIPRSTELLAVLDQAGVEIEDGEMLLEREILPGGKSRAFAASRPVTASLLREIAPYLGDIHGQHDQQSLFSAESQREMLDAFAGASSVLDRVAIAWRGWRDAANKIEEIDRSEQEKLRLADLWRFQRGEIESAGLQADEESQLESERQVLQNVTRLQESAAAAYEALYDSESAAVSRIGSALRRLEEAARIDPAIASVLESLRPAAIAIEDGSLELRSYLGRLEADPARLEEVETRLASIEKLKRKYGGSVLQVLAFLDDVRSQIEALETSSERREHLERERVRWQAEFDRAAMELTAMRKDSARKLSARVAKELAALAMEGTVFRIELSPREPSNAGVDAVSFLVSPNIGEDPKPLDRVASGGELSRIALALKTCTSAPPSRDAGPPRTLVFDEVDAGIGGAAASSVGKRLKSLAASHQVLCVTHLAQIAGFGDRHYYVEKRESRGRTVATVEEVTGQARVREIGRMLSGPDLTPEALKHAQQLIQSGAKD